MGGESSRIAGQAGRMFAGGAWHGPSVSEALAGVDARLALGRPVAGAYSIWEVVLHLAATQAALLSRARGDPAPLADGELLRPAPASASEAEWAELLALLARQEAELRRVIADFPDERLGEPLVPGGSPAYDTFHGHVQHGAYHAGQIMLLRRLGRAGR